MALKLDALHLNTGFIWYRAPSVNEGRFYCSIALKTTDYIGDPGLANEKSMKANN